MSIRERARPPDLTATGRAEGTGHRSLDDAGLALADIYRDHHAAVTGVARRVCGAAHAADVTQDVFLALWQHPDRFDPDRGSMRSFLSALAHNKAVDVVRSEQARRRREERIGSSDTPSHCEADSSVLHGDAAAQVRAAIGDLPIREREVILDTFYGGCTYRGTAARLGQPEGTVKSRIRAGLHHLRPALTHLAVDLNDPGHGTADDALCVEAPQQWFAPPSPAELRLLDLAVGPVLDIGCGPGRHVLALARSGIAAVGIDLSPHVVALARRRGATVLQGSVFGTVPGAGRWGTCLLLDGNIGIGARPDTLLTRARSLLEPGGTVLVETAAPGAPPRQRNMRLAVNGTAGPAFNWTDVGADRLPHLAAAASLTLQRSWQAERRWFAWLTAA